MSKVIEINGCVTVSTDTTHTEFLKKFSEFLEDNGWYFGGGSQAFIDDEPVDE
jgi:hypothetical protein